MDVREAHQDVVSEDEALRGQVYRLLSRYLARPMGQDELAAAQVLLGDESPFGRAVDRLAAAARATSVEAESIAFHELFIGLGRGRLVPFGSFYLTGFLNEKPLAKLREDLAVLGFERADGVREPEDHVAALSEVMAHLIEGAADFGAQRTFFDAHVGSWFDVFFGDLERSRVTAFYDALGSVGRVFIGIEKSAFEMVG